MPLDIAWLPLNESWWKKIKPEIRLKAQLLNRAMWSPQTWPAWGFSWPKTAGVCLGMLENENSPSGSGRMGLLNFFIPVRLPESLTIIWAEWGGGRRGVRSMIWKFSTNSVPQSHYMFSYSFCRMVRWVKKIKIHKFAFKPWFSCLLNVSLVSHRISLGSSFLICKVGIILYLIGFYNDHGKMYIWG